MTDRLRQLWTKPTIASQWANPWNRDPEWGGVGIREMIALMAVAATILAATAAILEVVGFDVAAWLQDQFGAAE